ncbi:nitroreductase family protein [Mesonia aestuariivivens]|uniref:Putative NAD(P)H nitroreductase n=1 Tax=Mesonia aestuariivivens TaxID=2796128 RepID=A0ABS6W3F7_9FLAO|nr:nitroreductase [Mesonia aestuariivivens]MBW2962254.1 nitroreductase [Mesonia aestuariivivens]
MIEDIIKNRRSIFPAQYNSEKIDDEVINKILATANWAPTHKKTEPWRFKVVREEKLEHLGQFLADKYKETTDKFSEFKYKKLQDNPTKASCVIAICMQRDPKESLPEWEEIAAVAMAVQNMWLTASHLGIGAYWSSPGLIKHMDEFFSLKKGEKCLGFFYMGHHNETNLEAERSPIESKVEWL